MILKYKFLLFLFAIVGALGQFCEQKLKYSNKCRDESYCFGTSAAECQHEPICQQKSVLKCKEYGQYVYKKVFTGALSLRASIHNVSECSVGATSLIVGGELAEEKEFPHMAAIGFGKNHHSVEWMCGGSLISENFILSAAHCKDGGSWGQPILARLGSLKLEHVDSQTQDIPIKEIITHPKFKLPSFYNDIALFKLSRAAKLNGFVRPACILPSFSEYKYKKVIASGWGKTFYEADEGSNDLRKVYLNLLGNSFCNTTFSEEIGGEFLRVGVSPSQICAGVLAGGKDTCQGDSGGPLQVILSEPYCMYRILGITSIGKFCAFKNSPALYTRVSCFISWIESIVWP